MNEERGLSMRIKSHCVMKTLCECIRDCLTTISNASLATVGRQVLDTAIDQYLTLRNPPLQGYFGLQNHGVGAQFRNLRYLRLSPESGSEAATSR